ncbi:MAG: glycoside hydrolase family 13 protein [Propionibacteriaceae bacterium]|jgi:glycosidase|nr:glycoside hydrolase family 13 protein [Propionibacteriaceae bacterium]
MTAPDWLADAIFYQIFPDRFANADHSLDPPDVVAWDSQPTRDNFFGGDLAGITQHLDHIASLGVNALYLTPIFAAGTNHRYDAVDYFKIDHRLGGLDDFHDLLDAAHSLGIRVVLDAVLNHCGDQHWAFRDVVANEDSSPYLNWYFVEGFPVSATPQPNYRTCSGCAYLPKWNAYNPEVRKHHYDVARYWIEQGIDGWRLDVPYFINRTFWRGFRDVVKQIDPALYIVAEEWRDPMEWLRGDTADGTMNYTLRELILGFTADRSLDAFGLAEGMNRLQYRIPSGYQRGMLNLLGSHDTERVLTRHGGDQAATQLAYTLLFSAEGAPMIYYGDEVGLAGENDPLCRGAMPWDESVWSKPTLAFIRDLAAARKACAALRSGFQDVTALDADTVLITRRAADSLAAAVVHRGPGTRVPVGRLPELGPDQRWEVLLGSEPGAADLLIPAAGFALLEARHRQGRQ